MTSRLTFDIASAVYHLVRQQIRLQVEVPPEVGALAAEAIEDVDEGAPLLRDFASDA
jgi:precorrin-3B methylase